MTTYYHGGVPGLSAGDLLLPPAETGERSQADLGNGKCRRDRVYLTTVPVVASMMAAAWRIDTADVSGDVYEVEPLGEVEPDPDYSGPAGESVQVPRALVIRLVKMGAPRRRVRHGQPAR